MFEIAYSSAFLLAYRLCWKEGNAVHLNLFLQCLIPNRKSLPYKFCISIYFIFNSQRKKTSTCLVALGQTVVRFSLSMIKMVRWNEERTRVYTWLYVFAGKCIHIIWDQFVGSGHVDFATAKADEMVCLLFVVLMIICYSRLIHDEWLKHKKSPIIYVIVDQVLYLNTDHCTRENKTMKHKFSNDASKHDCQWQPR